METFVAVKRSKVVTNTTKTSLKKNFMPLRKSINPTRKPIDFVIEELKDYNNPNDLGLPQICQKFHQNAKIKRSHAVSDATFADIADIREPLYWPKNAAVGR